MPTKMPGYVLNDNMITILRGPAGAGKSTCLYRTVLQLSKEHKDKNHILCVPEQFTLTAMKLIMEMSSSRGMLNIDVLSFNRLSYRIFQEAGSGSFELLDDTAKNLIIRHIASQRKDDLKLFGANLRKQGYVSSIKSALSEFMQYGCALRDIDRMIGECEGDEPYLCLKLKDIRIIYEEFLKRLGTDYTTVEELYNAASKKVKDAPFLKDANIYFDGFTGFTPVQYELIAGLMDTVKDIYVTITDDDSDLAMFDTGIKTMEKLGKLSGKELRIIDVNDGRIVRHKDEPVFEFLVQNIFRRTKKRIGQKGRIHCAGAVDPLSEIRYVLYRIRKLSVTEKIRYREMAIILGNMESYSDSLKKESERSGIPIYVDETRGIDHNPFTRLLRAALKCAADDLSYESVFSLLRTGMTGCEAGDVDLAENYVCALKIRGMFAYKKPFVKTYRGIDEDMRLSAEKVRKRVYGILYPLWEIRGEASVREYTKRLYDFTKTLDIRSQLDEATEGFKNENDEVRSLEFRQIYPLIMQLFDRMVSLLGEERMDIEEYSSIMDAGLSEIRVGTLPPVSDCVMAGDLQRSRFNDIKVLFVMGLSEQNIPGACKKGGMISESDRAFLRTRDFELSPTAAENADLNALYFYTNIAKPSAYLYLSYSQSSKDSGSDRPSFFMKEVMRLFNDLKEEGAQDLPKDRIFNRSDALIRLSETIKADTPEENRQACALLKLFKDDPGTQTILDASFRENATYISEAAARAVFSSKKQESATELERFAACAYQHYLRYGLGLRESLEFEFAPSDLGTILHDVLKKYSEKLKARDLSFAGAGDEVSDQILDEAFWESLSENEKTENLFESSGRNAYMKRRLIRIAKRTVDTLRYQSAKGSFSPSGFEKRFSHEGLKGFIDRIDRFEDGTGIYLEVIDYKSGNKAYDSDRVYWGLDLQLVIYMSAALELEVREGADPENVHPAGLFYYHIDDPVVEAEGRTSDEEILSKIRGQLKLKGIVNRDGDIPGLFDRDFPVTGKSDIIPVKRKNNGEFDAYSRVVTEEELKGIMKRTSDLTRDFRRQINEGYIEKNPYELDGVTACDHCTYSLICSGGKKRKLKKQ